MNCHLCLLSHEPDFLGGGAYGLEIISASVGMGRL